LNSAEIGNFEGNEKVFKIDPILKHLSKFSSLHGLKKDILLDEVFTLCKGRLGVSLYIPLKAAKFRIKCFEPCVCDGYLWNIGWV
jgi:hypothetical protein